MFGCAKICGMKVVPEVIRCVLELEKLEVLDRIYL